MDSKRDTWISSVLFWPVLPILILAFACAPTAPEVVESETAVETVGLTAVRTIEVVEGPESMSVVLEGSAPLSYKVSERRDPLRLVLDLFDTEVGAVEGRRPVEVAPISWIEAEQLDHEGTLDARVSIGLSKYLENQAVDYDVWQEGSLLTISLLRPGSTSSPSEEAAPAAPAVRTGEPEGVGAAVQTSADEGLGPPDSYALGREVAAVAVPEEALPGDIIAIETDEGPGWARVSIIAAEELRSPKNFELMGPNRVVVDFQDVSFFCPVDTIELDGDPVQRIRFGVYEEKVRIVFDFVQDIPVYTASEQSGRLVLVFGSAPPMPLLSAPEKPDRSAPPPAAEERKDAGDLVSINYLILPDMARIIVTTDGLIPYRAAQLSEDRIDLELPGARIDVRKEKPIHVAEVEGPVAEIRPAFANLVDGPGVRVSIILREPATCRPSQQINRIFLDFPLHNRALESRIEEEPDPATAAQDAPADRPMARAQPDASAAAPIPSVNNDPSQILEAQRKVYTGERVSFDFKDADIKNVLRLIAEVSELNLVAGDDVQGNVTIKLHDVPWDQALDVILRTHDLGFELDGNIMRIAPMKKLSREKEDVLKVRKTQERVEELVLEIIPVNYASVSELLTKLSPMKSDRGDAQMFMDERTNSIVVKDLRRNVEEMSMLIRSLDSQTRQVMIEARIVDLDVKYERELGIQWGVGYLASPATGNPTGVNFPATVGVTGGGGGDAFAPTQGFNVNAPAENAAGTVGLVFGSILNTMNLDIRLSALEKDGHAKIISMPRIATLDNQEARIEQGEEIPISAGASSSTPANIEYKEAKLKLSVTPHITSDNSIIMDVDITNDTVIETASSIPNIGTKRVNTKILVKNNDTAVIGGIYTRTESTDVSGVPWFMKIPVLKALFRNEQVTDNKKELIIFITPRIVPERLFGQISQKSDLVEQAE